MKKNIILRYIQGNYINIPVTDQFVWITNIRLQVNKPTQLYNFNTNISKVFSSDNNAYILDFNQI